LDVCSTGYRHDNPCDTITPGNTKIIEINFDATDMDEGTYTGNVKIESNDPDNPEVNVPVTLNVTTGGAPLAVSATATPASICMGETSQLEAFATGGSGVYTYLWTSDPPGFNSTIVNPLVTPEETTTYFVEVDDGIGAVNAQATVVVEYTPEQAATPVGDDNLCIGTYQTVYNSAGAAGSLFYNWIIEPEEAGITEGTGLTTTVTWNEMFTGMASIMVQGVNACGDGEMSEALEVMVNPLPIVDLGEDMEVCANETVLLDAGNPGATYLWSTGETTQTITVDTTGVGIGMVEYWVEVTDINGCLNTDEINIEFKDCTGISELTDKWSVNVYPNPNNGIFDVQLQTVRKQAVNLTVINALGKVVYNAEQLMGSKNASVNINLSHLNSGVYYLQVYGDGINVNQKIIVRK